MTSCGVRNLLPNQPLTLELKHSRSVLKSVISSSAFGPLPIWPFENLDLPCPPTSTPSSTTSSSKVRASTTSPRRTKPPGTKSPRSSIPSPRRSTCVPLSACSVCGMLRRISPAAAPQSQRSNPPSSLAVIRAIPRSSPAAAPPTPSSAPQSFKAAPADQFVLLARIPCRQLLLRRHLPPSQKSSPRPPVANPFESPPILFINPLKSLSTQVNLRSSVSRLLPFSRRTQQVAAEILPRRRLWTGHSSNFAFTGALQLACKRTL